MIGLALLLIKIDTAEALSRELLASSTATAVLQRRCAAPIHAEVDRGAKKDPTAEQRTRLQLGPDEPVAYRSVVLKCGDVALSVAENWYVPDRLLPEMNSALAGGNTPFGAVIRPLEPKRQTIETATQRSDPAIAPSILRHRALVLDGKGRPIAEVVENYTVEMLGLPAIG
jgi:chorismate-pyruvate lyase